MGCRDDFKDLFSVITTLASIVLYFFDLVTDIWLAVEYFINGDTIWGGLTTACICFPIPAFLILVIYMACKEDGWKSKCLVIPAVLCSPLLLITNSCGMFCRICSVCTGDKDDKYYRLSTMTQVLEALCESFPQLVLQIYILLVDESIRSGSDIGTSQYVSMTASIIMLSWSFTCYEKMMYYMINRKKMPICGVITVYVLKFCECFLRVLTFGMLVSILQSLQLKYIILIIVGILVVHVALLTVADLVRDCRSELNYTDFKRVGRLLYAAIQRVVCYTTINKIPNTLFRIIFYYSVVLLETVIFVVLWFCFKPERLDWISTDAWIGIFCVIGVLLIFSCGIYHVSEYHVYNGYKGYDNLNKEYCQFMVCPCMAN